jgi:hypothetical protein
MLQKWYPPHLSVFLCSLVGFLDRVRKTERHEVYLFMMLEVVTISEEHLFYCLDMEALLPLTPIDNPTFRLWISLLCWHGFYPFRL